MIYLDNASTSFPKAPLVAESVYTFIKDIGRNINRTNSEISYQEVDNLISLREDIASLVGKRGEETVFLNSGLTESINTVIRGFLKKGDHVIISATEHNAVMRCIADLGLDYSMPRTERNGQNILGDIIKLKKSNTKAIIFNISSNVTGCIEDVEKLSEIARELSLPLILDTAQALPYVDIKMDEMEIKAICFSGHKGLLGPQGTGGFILEKEFANYLKPLYTGGTGSRSDSFLQPEFFPDKFESGTRNLPGLYGLSTSVKYVKENLEILRQKERENTLYLLNGLLELSNITLHGNIGENRNAVISISAKKIDNAILAENLLARHQIETRVGLHCAVNAHKALGTYPGGTIRLSPGPFTTKDELEKAIYAIKEETK